MRSRLVGLIYFLFFLSGAAALMYEVIWVRSLSLVFGGTHLAVTAVLSVFMGGLALGSYLLGRIIDRVERPLMLYGYLELGIGASALMFLGLMKVYPSLYILFAQGKDSYTQYLTLIRVLFALFALIVPTTLMGGTLPVLTRFVSPRDARLGPQLSFLYGLNTLGAVFGASIAGFLLLPFTSINRTISIAIAINVLVWLIVFLFPDRLQQSRDSLLIDAEGSDERRPTSSEDRMTERSGTEETQPMRLVLFGIAVSGFCALGYEVLWTRVISMTVGTSVYGFTIMLISFLTGIAVGSSAYGLFLRPLQWRNAELRHHMIAFGMVQCIIGVVALYVTMHIQELPEQALTLRHFFSTFDLSAFGVHQWSNMTLAFTYMAIPAFFMGLAFPLAGYVSVAYKNRIGHAVGNLLTYNTIGAIFGSAISGFLLLSLLGLERSLQILTVINVGYGLIVIAGIGKRKVTTVVIGGLTVVVVLFLGINQDLFRAWDQKYFSIFQSNRPETFRTEEARRNILENTEVLFYHEGINSTTSVFKVKGGVQALLVSGKVVASDSLIDQQCELTLGHLPMLLHKDPKKVLVVGLGTGMTLGATSVHPSVEELTLAEIEPQVVGAARTFGMENHHVLDNPKLKIVFNDGRNFLMTTRNQYDVITADPIHPWVQGAGYLYTDEYFKIASKRLRPGGIMCQWLPIYELNLRDLKTVFRTFSRNFQYTMVWMTHYDVELIGSNSPLVIDEKELEQRMAVPAIRSDLNRIMMGSAKDFLSYFLMGTARMRAFGEGGIVNTDDNLYLEFSAPRSIGLGLTGDNAAVLEQYRESILPFLVPAVPASARTAQIKRWKDLEVPIHMMDEAHVLYLNGKTGSRFELVMSEFKDRYPEFGPARFLWERYLEDVRGNPTLLRQASFDLRETSGRKSTLVISAVLVPVSQERVSVMIVDNAAKVIYGEEYIDGTGKDDVIHRIVDEVMESMRTAYQREAAAARERGSDLPDAETMKHRLKDAVKQTMPGQAES
jgi:spermidine synthase